MPTSHARYRTLTSVPMHSSRIRQGALLRQHVEEACGVQQLSDVTRHLCWFDSLTRQRLLLRLLLLLIDERFSSRLGG